MPVVPLWNFISVVGWSPGVSAVRVTWNGLPDYENIRKN
ncbi:extracellular solute-binding protein%2C family protein 5 [Mycobacterium tuberculosis]|nr:extracellular solute-binding protein%2C family protein 5 [Mycobacterium tuberculosis]